MKLWVKYDILLLKIRYKHASTLVTKRSPLILLLNNEFTLILNYAKYAAYIFSILMDLSVSLYLFLSGIMIIFCAI